VPTDPLRRRLNLPAVLIQMSKAFPLPFPDDSEIIVGDALIELKRFPDGVFQSCITSPPYWGLRDYGFEGQLGSERYLPSYIRRLRQIFSQVKRVLRDDGTLWLNIGDSYTSGNRGWRAADRKNPSRAMNYRPPTPTGLKPKDLIGLPWRVAFALQQRRLSNQHTWHWKEYLTPQPERGYPAQMVLSNVG